MKLNEVNRNQWKTKQETILVIFMELVIIKVKNLNMVITIQL